MLFFIELGTRKNYGSGCTTNSDTPGSLIGVDDTIRIKAGEYIGIIQLVPDLNEFISTEVEAVKFRYQVEHVQRTMWESRGKPQT